VIGDLAASQGVVAIPTLDRLFRIGHPRSGASYAIALLGVGFLLALGAALVLHLQDLLRSEVARTVERTERLALVVEKNAARTFDNAAVTVERVRDQLFGASLARRVEEPLFRDTVQRIARLVPHAVVQIVDAQGRVRLTVTTGEKQAPEIARLPAFAEHRDGVAALRISPPQGGSLSEDRQLTLTTRIDDERGRFAGVVALSMPMSVIITPRDTSTGGFVDAVALHLEDGTPLARSPLAADPDDEVEPRRAALSEIYRDTESSDTLRDVDLDGVERIVRYRRLADWPVMVVVKADASRFRAAWAEHATRYAIVALLLGVITVCLVTMLIRQVERRQESERRLRDAVDNVTEAFAIYDSQDRLVLCTRAFAAHYAGIEAPDELVGLDHDAIVRRSLALGERPEDGMSAEEWRSVCAARHANPPAEPWIRRLAGNRFALVSERRLPDGGTVAVSTDITTIKQREQQLELARHDAELANRSKTRFLAAMSHELRTPLNAILGFSEVIRDQRFGRSAAERYASYAGDIHRSGQHLLQLISDLLDTSKIEAGRYTLHEDVVDPMAIIDDAVGMLRERARNAGIRLRVHTEEQLPLLWGDDRALRQVLLNLLGNAVKFTPKGGRVEVYGAVDQDGWMRIAVGDTGTGIPEAIRPRLFQPFAQAGSPMVRNKEGTGLGLAISRGLMELHGGTIGIESAEGQGTIVTLRLPPDRIRDRTDTLRRAS
jgi:signal transduction histidine kinase